MLPIDHDIRDQALIQNGNIVISASAGTGKTHTTVLRINHDAFENKNYKTFAAITFTRKAAKEIANRLGINRGDGFVGTNDNFVLTEVIQPFMYDAFGIDFKINITPDYSTSNAIRNFNEGVRKIKETGLMCKHVSNRKNFAFKLALEILKNSHSAGRYLKSKFYRIYIDEYQDCDVDMHNFFMYVCDELLIPLFIVGDEKQSIYGWRGAYCEGFTGLFEKEGFYKFELRHNFRSNIAIQNYSNIFMSSVRHYYQPIAFDNEVIIYKYNDIEDACHYICNWIKPDKRCAMLNYRRDTARDWSNALNLLDLDFIYVSDCPIENPNLESEHIWIARGIASYILKYRYSEYDFRDDIPIPENFKVSSLKRKLDLIKDNKENREPFKASCKDLYNFLGFDETTTTVENEISILHSVLSDDQYISFYNQERYMFTSGTIHSSKGLEFNQVIINANDYDFSQDDNKYLHYVAVTRPEERLLILANDSSYSRYHEYIEDAVSEANDLGIEVSIADIVDIE